MFFLLYVLCIVMPVACCLYRHPWCQIAQRRAVVDDSRQVDQEEQSFVRTSFSAEISRYFLLYITLFLDCSCCILLLIKGFLIKESLFLNSFFPVVRKSAIVCVIVARRAQQYYRYCSFSYIYDIFWAQQHVQI